MIRIEAVKSFPLLSEFHLIFAENYKHKIVLSLNKAEKGSLKKFSNRSILLKLIINVSSLRIFLVNRIFSIISSSPKICIIKYSLVSNDNIFHNFLDKTFQSQRLCLLTLTMIILSSSTVPCDNSENNN